MGSNNKKARTLFEFESNIKKYMEILLKILFQKNEHYYFFNRVSPD